MTASSVDIFPYRVQLMGLPPSSNSAEATNTFRAPPVAKLHKVSRNLFGSPDRDEMQRLYQQEADRVRSYVLQRYSFDIKNIPHTNEKEHRKQSANKNTSQTYTHPTQIPTTIEEKFNHHEHRLSERELPESKLVKQQALTCSEFSSASQSKVDQKPYKRQSLLKESFNIRKKRVGMKKVDQNLNSETLTLENTHRNLEILQLSQHLILQQNLCDIQDTGKESATSKKYISLQHAKIRQENKKSRRISCSDSSKALSLDIGVSRDAI